MRTLLTLVVLLLCLPGKASAVWVSVSAQSFHVQHVCRDGLVVDLASQLETDQTVWLWVADGTATLPASQYFFHTSTVRIYPVVTPDVPEMGEPLNNAVRAMSRNNRVLWNTTRVAGSEVQVTAGNTMNFYRHRVENCSVNDRFDPFSVGYVWAHKPTTASYTPVPYWSYNSKLLTNNITRTGVGVYTVEFPGLAGTGGNAHVTAFGSTAANCKIGSSRWYSSGTAMRLDVRCYSNTGTPADSRFTASYTAGQGAANSMAFALAEQPSTAFYPVHPAYQYNNSGGVITVTRSAAGDYRVLMPNVFGSRKAGSVKVTAVGATPVSCKAEGWAPTGPGLSAHVLCFTPAGAAADQQFTVAYMDGMNVLGNNGMADGYVLANEPQSAAYTPVSSYQRNTTVNQSGTVTISRSAVGTYDVRLPLQETTRSDHGAGWDGGTVHVTAFGADSARCQVGHWKDSQWQLGPGRTARVYCFNFKGALTDAMFTLQYTAQIQ